MISEQKSMNTNERAFKARISVKRYSVKRVFDIIIYAMNEHVAEDKVYSEYPDAEVLQIVKLYTS